jgi:hypothetical protein
MPPRYWVLIAACWQLYWSCVPESTSSNEIQNINRHQICLISKVFQLPSSVLRKLKNTTVKYEYIKQEIREPTCALLQYKAMRPRWRVPTLCNNATPQRRRLHDIMQCTTFAVDVLRRRNAYTWCDVRFSRRQRKWLSYNKRDGNIPEDSHLQTYTFITKKSREISKNALRNSVNSKQNTGSVLVKIISKHVHKA